MKIFNHHYYSEKQAKIMEGNSGKKKLCRLENGDITVYTMRITTTSRKEPVDREYLSNFNDLEYLGIGEYYNKT